MRTDHRPHATVCGPPSLQVRRGLSPAGWLGLPALVRGSVPGPGPLREGGPGATWAHPRLPARPVPSRGQGPGQGVAGGRKSSLRQDQSPGTVPNPPAGPPHGVSPSGCSPSLALHPGQRPPQLRSLTAKGSQEWTQLTSSSSKSRDRSQGRSCWPRSRCRPSSDSWSPSAPSGRTSGPCLSAPVCPGSASHPRVLAWVSLPPAAHPPDVTAQRRSSLWDLADIHHPAPAPGPGPPHRRTFWRGHPAVWSAGPGTPGLRHMLAEAGLGSPVWGDSCQHPQGLL